jgi:hypothetical protein
VIFPHSLPWTIIIDLVCVYGDGIGTKFNVTYYVFNVIRTIMLKSNNFVSFI